MAGRPNIAGLKGKNSAPPPQQRNSCSPPCAAVLTQPFCLFSSRASQKSCRCPPSYLDITGMISFSKSAASTNKLLRTYSERYPSCPSIQTLTATHLLTSNDSSGAFRHYSLAVDALSSPSEKTALAMKISVTFFNHHRLTEALQFLYKALDRGEAATTATATRVPVYETLASMFLGNSPLFLDEKHLAYFRTLSGRNEALKTGESSFVKTLLFAAAAALLAEAAGA